jgi:hypothetical protein
MTKQEAVTVLVRTLRPFRLSEADVGPHYPDETIRDIVWDAMRELEVYDAYGCPLCLS